jgi:hypothetical protein
MCCVGDGVVCWVVDYFISVVIGVKVNLRFLSEGGGGSAENYNLV